MKNVSYETPEIKLTPVETSDAITCSEQTILPPDPIG